MNDTSPLTTLPPNHPSSISSWTLPLIQALKDYGIDPKPLLEQSEINPDLLSNPDARIRVEAMARLWKLAVLHTGNECVGISAAFHIRPTTFHALGFALMVSNSLNDALKRLRRFYQMVSDTISIELEYGSQTVAVTLCPIMGVPQPAAEAIDMAMAAIILFAQMVVNGPLKPVKVDFCREAPADASIFHHTFKAPVTFQAPLNRIVFNLSDVQKELPTANSEIARCNDALVVEYLADSVKSDLSRRLYPLIVELMPLGELSSEKLAGLLGISAKNLHRQLRREGLSYRGLVEEIRKQLAARYLRMDQMSIIEVAFQLGYTDSGNFTRAFKRWYSMSPSQYRHSRASIVATTDSYEIKTDLARRVTP